MARSYENESLFRSMLPDVGINALEAFGRGTDRVRDYLDEPFFSQGDPMASLGAPMQEVKPGASEAEVNKAMVSLLKTKAAEAGEAEKRHKVERQNATHDLLARLQAQSSPDTQSFVVRGSKRDPGGRGDIILSSPGDDENKGSYSKYVNRVGEYDKATLKEQGVPTDVAYLADKLETSGGPKAALQFLMERLSPQVPIEQRMAELQSKSKDPAAMNPIIKAIFMRNGWTKEMIDEYFGGKKE